MIIVNNPDKILEQLNLEGKLRDLNEQEYLAIDKISRDMQEVRKEYMLMQHNSYIEASKRPFTC
jgi:hypothetical protein